MSYFPAVYQSTMLNKPIMVLFDNETEGTIVAIPKGTPASIGNYFNSGEPVSKSDAWYIVYTATIEAHRSPTPWEVKFGEGAIHYKTMPIEHWIKPDGTLKKWTICPQDGLRYYRSTH